MTKIKPLKYSLRRINGINLHCWVVMAPKTKPGENLTAEIFYWWKIPDLRPTLNKSCIGGAVEETVCKLYWLLVIKLLSHNSCELLGLRCVYQEQTKHRSKRNTNGSSYAPGVYSSTYMRQMTITFWCMYSSQQQWIRKKESTQWWILQCSWGLIVHLCSNKSFCERVMGDCRNGSGWIMWVCSLHVLDQSFP